MIDLSGKRIIISRTDSIGDVMLTFPICNWIKSNFKNTTILFLGKGYTRSVVEAYSDIDKFIDWKEIEELPQVQKKDEFSKLKADCIVHVFPNKEIAALAKKVKIKDRVGTSHRTYHLLTCNHRVNFTRKRSDLHEAQLNFELLRPFGLNEVPSLDQIIKTTSSFEVKQMPLPQDFQGLTNYTVLHPKSQGSAKEWPMENYMELASELVSKGKTVVFTGTQSEGAQFKGLIPSSDHIVDTTGKLSLEELMVLISQADNLVACSTGPLHIAGYTSVNTVGLYSPKRPIHPGRWKALGPNVNIIVKDEECELCSQGKDCDCIEMISVASVLEKLK